MWRISVPLQSFGCNETGHWLHDGPSPTGRVPLSLFSLSYVFGYWSQDFGCILGFKTMNSAHIRVLLFKQIYLPPVRVTEN